MPQVVRIIRQRRGRGVHTAGILGKGLLFRVALAGVSILLLTGVITIAVVQAEVTSNLPPVTTLESHFGSLGHERYTPVRFYDRSGEIVLYEAFNPVAQEPRWLYIQDGGPIDIQAHTLQALLAVIDPDFLRRSSPNVFGMARDFFRILLGTSTSQPSTYIPRALVEAQLLPLGTENLPDNIEQARAHLLAQEIARRFPKTKILEWFVNSVDFGSDAYGLDAAALVYLGKHANELSLGESALLAPIVLQPTLNPLDALEESQERQARLLETMTALGWITAGQARAAAEENIAIQGLEGSGLTPLQEILGRWLKERLGSQALSRSGLTVFTTIDEQLQLQAECTMATQLKRLDGGLGNETVAAANGDACLAASLLPPLRPRDQGIAHQIETGAFIVLDPQSGEILALAGSVDLALPADAVLSPLIYLTAFSQGYSPGSMVLDLPLPDLGSEPSQEFPDPVEAAHGPVRIRTALSNMYEFAVEQMLRIIGEDNFIRIGRNLGIRIHRNAEEKQAGVDRWQATLLDLTAAYSVLAYQGQKVGARVGENPGANDGVDLQPEILFEIQDGDRRLVYRYKQENRAVVSPQLTYLLNDILRDEPARWSLYGMGNALEIARPAAVIAGRSDDGHEAWTVGYTPTRVIGVWTGNPGGSPPQAMEVDNSAAAVWHALMRYATRDLPAQNWNTPPGVSSIEVCDPSGLLPTAYCPMVVREVYLAGTEPITYDNLYQPFQVNRETGKLATLYTPLEQIEELVFLVPPPEALAWAQAAGIEQPPKEYDTLTGDQASVPGVAISTPSPFSFVRGEVVVRGQANIDKFAFYRLQYGEGLNPTQWIQIDEGRDTPVSSGRLGIWGTSNLDGLYTLQLIVVDQEGQLFTSAVNLTIDNQPPTVEVILPIEGQEIDLSSEAGVVLQTSVIDAYGIDHVSFFLDGEQITTIASPPYSTRWSRISAGVHSFYIQVTDLAGNSIKSTPVEFNVVIPGE